MYGRQASCVYVGFVVKFRTKFEIRESENHIPAFGFTKQTC